MKRIELLIGKNLFTDGKRVFKDSIAFFNPGFNPDIRRFSVIVLYAKGFNFDNCKKIVDLYSFLHINDVTIVVSKENDKFMLKDGLSPLFSPWIRVGINPNPTSEGFYSSLKVGLRSVSRRTDFIILQFGTMAELKKETIYQLINISLKSKKDIIVPVFEDKRGHPIVFSHKLMPVLFSLRKEKGLPFLLRHYKGLIKEVPVNDSNILEK